MTTLSTLIERLSRAVRYFGRAGAQPKIKVNASSPVTPNANLSTPQQASEAPVADCQTSHTAPDTIDEGIEHLKDLQWELRDSEARYRDLLDNQSDIIIRRDHTGRLTFVNRAFCRTFGVETVDVIGVDYRLNVLQTSPDLTTQDAARLRRFEQQLLTTAGPRWFAFEQRTILNEDGELFEEQTIGHDVTEQKRIQAELAETRDQAMAANSAKSRFLAAMSHEIRTPMNGILGMTGLLMETAMSAEQRSYANAIDHSAKTLLTIIDEILDLSKIEAGKLELHPVTFPIDDCAQSVIELLAPKAAEKKLELVWRLDPDVPTLLVGDETRVRQILLNLVGNAIKFTDTGGIVVRISGSSAESFAPGDNSGFVLSIEVRDTGIGMSPAQMRGLFTEFEQAGDVVRRKRGGTGLGLAISQRLAKAMGGDISVTSDVNGGSTFVVRLKLHAAQGNRSHSLQTSMCVGRSVLLALDGAIERRELSEFLNSIQLPTDAVGIGEARCQIDRAAKRLPYDAVVIDAAAGPEVAGKLITHARSESPRPVRGIILIDQIGRKSLPEYRVAGFDAYLIRPVRPQSLMAQLLLTDPSEWTAPSNLPASSTRSSGATSATSKLRNILLVEDNEINALLARRVTERAGCKVTHARDGASALNECLNQLAGVEKPFDLVMMDIHMPDMDGFEATSRMKRLFADAGRRAPPIIAITANAFAEDRKRCLEAGLDDFLAKPFERSELEAILEKWCGAPCTSRDGALDEYAA